MIRTKELRHALCSAFAEWQNEKLTAKNACENICIKHKCMEMCTRAANEIMIELSAPTPASHTNSRAVFLCNSCIIHDT